MFLEVVYSPLTFTRPPSNVESPEVFVHFGECRFFLTGNRQRLSPKRRRERLEVDSRKASLFRLRTEDVESLLCLFHSADAVDELVRDEEREHGLVVDFIVVGLLEVVDEAGDELVHELVVRYVRAPDFVGLALFADCVVPEVVYVVVCPHQIELHTLVVGGFEEAVVERAFEKRSALVPVPVVDEHVDARSECRVNLARNDNRVVLFFVAPNRNERFAVSLEFRVGFVDVLPFAVAVLENSKLLPTRFGMVRRPDDCRHVVTCRSHSRRRARNREKY